MNQDYGIHAQLAPKLLALVNSGVSVKSAAIQLDVSATTAYKWVKVYKENSQ